MPCGSLTRDHFYKSTFSKFLFANNHPMGCVCSASRRFFKVWPQRSASVANPAASDPTYRPQPNVEYRHPTQAQPKRAHRCLAWRLHHLSQPCKARTWKFRRAVTQPCCSVCDAVGKRCFINHSRALRFELESAIRLKII